jgi:autotransporter-associated beta strand protein
MTKGKLFVKTLGLVALIFSSMIGVNAQTLIAHYPFNNTLAASAGNFGDAVIGTAGMATLGSSSVCTDNANNNGLRTPSITSLSTTNFQIDFTVNLTSMPTVANGPLFVINGGTRYFGLLLNQSGQLKILYNNAWESGIASGITLTTGTNYNIQVQYINGVTNLSVNNLVYLSTTLPTLDFINSDRTIYLGDNPGAPGAFIEGCYSNLKVYNSPSSLMPSLTVVSNGQTGTTGTNWSIVGNELIVTGPASIQASVIETALSNGDLLIKGSPEPLNITISQAINYSGASLRNLTLGNNSNTGIISLNANLSCNSNIRFNGSTFSSFGNIVTTAGSVITINISTNPTNSYSGVISGPGSLVKLGNGNLTLEGNSTFTGGTTISGGNIRIGNGSSSGLVGTGEVVLTNTNNSFVFNRTNNFTFSNLISGAGKIEKWHSGTVILTANNTFTGGISSFFGGKIQVGAGGTSGSLGTGNIEIYDNCHIDINRTDDFTMPNRFTGSYSTSTINKFGAGKLTLTGQNQTFIGVITVHAGTLELGNGTTMATWSSYSPGNSKIDVKTGANLILNNNSASTLNRDALIGTGTIIKDGTGALTLQKDLTCTTLTINSGSLIFGSNVKATISGVISNNGILEIGNTATLVQGASGTLAGAGTYNVKQAITGAGTTTPTGRFWYLGSPVSTSSSSVFFGNAANVLKKRDEQNNAWVAITSAAPENLEVGRGYYTQAMANSTITFTGGVLNNGSITTSNLTSAGAGFTGFNLVSNPYPSYIDWTTVTKTNVGGTMWYRTNDGTNMNFGTVNAAGVGTTIGSVVLTKYIPPMQAFWVRVSSYGQAASLGFENTMRSHFVSENSSVAGLKSTTNDESVFIRLNLQQADKIDQLIVYTDEQASNGLDQFDADKMMQASSPQFYTTVGGKPTVINALNPAKKQQSLPITMELPTTGVHSFIIEDLEISNGLVWLEDKQEEIIQTLEPGTVYEFYAASGMNAERFVLHFQLVDDAVPTNVYNEVNSSANFSGKGANVHAEAAGVVVIKLPASTEGVTDIQIRDAAGRLVYTGSTNTLETSVQLEQANGIYYVTLNSNSGVEVCKVFIQQ